MPLVFVSCLGLLILSLGVVSQQLPETTPIFGTDLGDVGVDRLGKKRQDVGYLCNQISPQKSIKAMLEIAAKGKDTLREEARLAATSAVSGLGWIALKRAFPEVADLFDQELARSEERLAQTQSKCHQMATEVDSDSTKWLNTAAQQSFKNKVVEQRGVVTAIDELQDYGASERGYPWVFSVEAGGSGQVPMRILKDTVAAVFAQLNQIWPTVRSSHEPNNQSVANWLVSVLGDLEISSDRNLDSNNRSSMVLHRVFGEGIWPSVMQLSADIRGELLESIASVRGKGSQSARLSWLTEYGVGSIAIRQLATLPDHELPLVTRRLSQEIAVAISIDQLLLSRRLIRLAIELPEVQNIAPAVDFLYQKDQDLLQELSLLQLEVQSRKSLQSSLQQLLQ